MVSGESFLVAPGPLTEHLSEATNFGFAQRALVITGPDGVVRWSYEAPSPGELPPFNLLRNGLRAAGAVR